LRLGPGRKKNDTKFFLDRFFLGPQQGFRSWKGMDMLGAGANGGSQHSSGVADLAPVVSRVATTFTQGTTAFWASVSAVCNGRSKLLAKQCTGQSFLMVRDWAR
jgi:hypothetical protein